MKASPHLHFRTLTTEDTKALIKIYSDVEAMKFRANPPVLNTEDALKMIEQAQQEDDGFAYKRWAVVRNDTNAVIGTCVFTYNKSKLTCTIGYSIGKDSWNKGYGKELLQAMVKEVRSTNYTMIKALVHPHNLASIAVLKKQQFYREDTNTSEHLWSYCLNLIQV